MSAEAINESRKIRVNKLFLIGNGFDLSLGLLTDYNSFLLWLIKSQLKTMFDNSKKPGFGNHTYRSPLMQSTTLIGYKDDEKHKSILNQIVKFSDLEEVMFEYDLNISINSDFFKKIYNDLKLGWVDIESIYFDHLKEILDITVKEARLDKLEKLNSDLDFLSEKLEEYLLTLNYDFGDETSSLYLKHFAHSINEFDVLYDDSIIIESGINYFLNFNYTSALESILNNIQTEVSYYRINNIHGELKSNENPIVFGFGDEMDGKYQEIEELRDNRFFKHIKSFKYFKTPNYRNLLRFLNSDPFQVCIYGHSCGLSDRVMLNEIFEHENCKSIKLFFYEKEDGTNDFMEKTMDISRHFRSNKDMRKKIVDFDPLNKIPQVTT